MDEKKETIKINESKQNTNAFSAEEFIDYVSKIDEKKFKSYSLTDTLYSTVDKVTNTAKESIVLHDSYYNTLYGSNGSGDMIQQSFANYGFSNDTLNFPLWTALYNDSWVFRKAIDKPAEDEVNSGFTMIGDADYSPIYKAYEKNKNDLIDLLKWGALYGGSIGVFIFDGISDEELGQPINKSKIKGASYKLYITDRWYGVSLIGNETVTNMKDIDFGLPKYYSVTFSDGRSIKVHHSYVLRYEHRGAPKLIKNGQLNGWGYAEGAHILNELSRDDQLKAEIQTLVGKANIEVIKMAGMKGVFLGADPENNEQLRKRLEMVNWGRNYNSLTFLDKDDEYTRNDFNGLSGLSDILQQNMWLIAAALDMPGILFGNLTSSGLNQQNDYMEQYAKTILNRCNAYFRKVLTKYFAILFIVYDIKGNVDYKFNSIIQEKVNNDKVSSINTFADMLTKLEGSNLISKYQMAMSLKDFIEKNIINVQFTEVQLNKLKFEEELEILEVYKKANQKPPSELNILGNNSENEIHNFNNNFENELNKEPMGEEENPPPDINTNNNGDNNE